MTGPVSRLLRMAARLYPATWRERYGAELEALLEDIEPVGRDVWDVLRGALIMRITAGNFGRVTALCGLAGLIVAGAIAYNMPANYESNAVLRITPMRIAEGTSQEATEAQMRDRLRQMGEEVLNRASLAGIITRPSMDLYHNDRTRIPLEDIVLGMRNKIRIRPVGKLAFAISYAYPNKFKAQAVVRELVSKFFALNLTQRSEKAANLAVLDPANLPDRPISPNRVALLLLGLAAGLLSGLIAALLLALRKRTGVVG